MGTWQPGPGVGVGVSVNVADNTNCNVRQVVTCHRKDLVCEDPERNELNNTSILNMLPEW